jgi:hypothetical protein
VTVLTDPTTQIGSAHAPARAAAAADHAGGPLIMPEATFVDYAYYSPVRHAERLVEDTVT